jgi:F0F1-type ATP synthase assembly protein I
MKVPEPGQINLIALCSEIGFKLAIPLLIFLLLGIKLDKSFSTLPLFTVIGILLSFTVSAFLIYQMIQMVNKKKVR